MIENGKRVPSERLIAVIAEIFQKDIQDWFFDESLEDDRDRHGARRRDAGPECRWNRASCSPRAAAAARHPRAPEPDRHNRPAVRAPADTRTPGNQPVTGFPDLERAAESIGNKLFPLKTEDVFRIAKRLGLDDTLVRPRDLQGRRRYEAAAQVRWSGHFSTRRTGST